MIDNVMNPPKILSVEKPIFKRSEDFLKRSNFSDNIADAIISYDEGNHESLTIGLYGKWGSGKTSIINMVVEKIQDETEDIVFKFEPWIYSDTQQLISHFFQGLAKAIGHHDNAQEALKIGEELETYATFFKPMVLIPEPTISTLSLLSSKIFGGLGRAIKKWGKLKAKDLSGTKESIEKHLLKLDKKILIIIDDIDRLNNTEIRQIFQMVKILGNFPNTIYMLSLDKAVVTVALSDVQKGDGTEYLEKIINIPFEVPSISQSDVQKFLFTKLDEIVLTMEEGDFDTNYWGNIFHSGFKDFFTNIRDVVRYASVLRFNYGVLKNDVNIVDLIAITAFQVFESKIFEVIQHNSNHFAGSFSEYGHNRDEDKKSTRDFFDATFSSLQKLSKKSYIKLIEELFPKIETAYNNVFYVDALKDYRKKSRICSPDFFDIYFKMTLNENELSNNDIKDMIEKASNEESFRELIIGLNENGKITRFLERLQDFTSTDIPNNKFQVIFNVLMDEGDTFPIGREGIFQSSNQMQIMRIFYQIAHTIEDKEIRFKLYEESIKKAEKSISIACSEIGILMQQHGEYPDSKPTADEKITVEQDRLQELKEIIKCKIQNWADNHDLFLHKNAISIMYLWKKLDEESLSQYISSKLNSAQEIGNFLKLFVRVSFSHGSGDYQGRKEETYDFQFISDFVDIDSIVKKLREMKNDILKYQNSNNMEIAITNFIDNYDGITDNDE